MFARYFKLLIPKDTVLLGRWALREEMPVRFKQFDLANVDHCGTCTMTFNDKKKKKNSKKTK